MVLTKKRVTNLETHLLEVTHMSRPNLSYLDLPNLKPTFLNVSGLYLICSNLVGGYLAVALIILGLVAVTKVKLHTTSSIIMSVVARPLSYDTFDICAQGGKLGGGMRL